MYKEVVCEIRGRREPIISYFGATCTSNSVGSTVVRLATHPLLTENNSCTLSYGEYMEQSLKIYDFSQGGNT